MRTIYTYVECTKAITNSQNIRPSVTIKILLVIILKITKWIFIIKVAWESTHQKVLIKWFLMIYYISYNNQYS